MKSRLLPLVLAAGIATTAHAAVDKDKTITVNASWEASDGTKLPVHGAKIEIFENIIGPLPPGGMLTKVTEGFLSGGSFAFTSPSDGFLYLVRLTATFQGVDASGNLASGGAGQFHLRLGNPDSANPGTPGTATGSNATASGDILSYDFLGDTETLTHAVARTHGNSSTTTISEGDVWSVFHGFAEMVTEARTKLNVSKNAFSVHFPATGSNYPGGARINLLKLDRYDWDVIAHEFGHAIGDETQTQDFTQVAGGPHDGSNQYDFAGNTTTKGDKAKSLSLAFSEGFGTWFGCVLLAESTRYRGKVPGVGDTIYSDTEDATLSTNLETNTAPRAFGDDTEEALYCLMWDLHDSPIDALGKLAGAGVAGLKDGVALKPSGLWALLNGKKHVTIHDLWEEFTKGREADFTQVAGSDISNPGELATLVKRAELFAEFGVSPALTTPASKTMIDLTPSAVTSMITFQWDQLDSGSGALSLDRFTLVIYSDDFSRVLYRKADIAAKELVLAKADVESLLDEIHKLEDEGKPTHSVKVLVWGTNGSAGAPSSARNLETGPYASNAIELIVEAYDRLVVGVVDSSGSNTSTDPSNLRVTAASETVHRLTSDAEATAMMTFADRAAAIDFDSSVSVLAPFGDPDTVAPAFNAIDSSGGTAIHLGIQQAITLIEAFDPDEVYRDRSAIVVFTDGENGAGDAPVIAAIDAATARGIKVFRGFLQPQSVIFSANGSLAVSPELFAEPGKDDGRPRPIDGGKPGGPVSTAVSATIEEALLNSGGFDARIFDDVSQLAFVDQIFDQGITTSDDSGILGGRIVGQTLFAQRLTPDQDEVSWTFSARDQEEVTLVIDSPDFLPDLTLLDAGSGALLGVDLDTDQDGSAAITFTAPAAGDYTLIVRTLDGAVGRYSVFVDVQNPGVGGLGSAVALGDPELDLQTGLFRQQVEYTAPAGGAGNGVRIHVDGLVNGDTLYNAHGEEGGRPYVDIRNPVAAGASVILTLEYYSPSRTFSSNPAFGTASPGPAADPGGTVHSSLNPRLAFANSGDILLEFDTRSGNEYFIQFSEDGVTWVTIPTAIAGTGSRVQWIDNGPPKTPCHPRDCPSRFYRLVER